MKITEVKVFHLYPGADESGNRRGKYWNFVFVKVYTDAGIDGVGEAFASGKAKTTEAAVREYERWLVGKDPTEVLRNWLAYYRGSRYPLGTATKAALSAVEIALWDISGKACGLPVYKMLGGPVRDRIRLYASMPPGPDFSGLEEMVKKGFTAVKFGPQPDGYEAMTPRQVLAESINRVKRAREVAGPDVDILLDYHGRSFSPTEAIKLAHALEDDPPLFIEEPAMTEAPDSLVEVKSKTTIPIAGGERCVHRETLREILEKRAVHILQPDPCANGGILETIKWAAMCELYHIVIAPHQSISPISLTAAAHIDACVPNFLIQECNTVDLYAPWVKDVFPELPVIEDGHMMLPDKPGLGIEIDEDAIADYEWEPVDRPVMIEADGAIGLE